jgi:hypothetical protein
MNFNLSNAAASIFFIIAIFVSTAVCQTESVKSKMAGGNLPKIEHFEKPTVYQYKPENLPAPFHTESARRFSKP